MPSKRTSAKAKHTEKLIRSAERARFLNEVMASGRRPTPPHPATVRRATLTLVLAQLLLESRQLRDESRRLRALARHLHQKMAALAEKINAAETAAKSAPPHHGHPQE